MHNQSSLIMCSSRWVLGALSRCRCCASNIHVLGASTMASPWTWIMPRKSAAPRNARESCYWQPGGPSALRTSGRTNIISRTAHSLWYLIGPRLGWHKPPASRRVRGVVCFCAFGPVSCVCVSVGPVGGLELYCMECRVYLSHCTVGGLLRYNGTDCY